MYDYQIRNIIVESLESEIDNIFRSIIGLASQGYIVNDCKYVRANNARILKDCFESSNILTNQQRTNIANIYNKLARL